MFNKLNQIGFVAVGAWACVALNTVSAQEQGYAKLYEQGVNAYFAGSAYHADQFLSEALTFNSQDPRAYYFRAFSLLRQGRIDEARGDMLVGAMLEAEHPQRFAVGTALERVQGCDRLMLERFRREARANTVVQASATFAVPAAAPPTATFVTPQERASGVLREKRVVPLEELLRPTGPQSFPDEPVAAPSTPVPPQGNQPAATQPAETPAAPEANPFGDDTEAKPAPAAPATPAPPQTAPESAPPATPPATPPAEDENPFGG